MKLLTKIEAHKRASLFLTLMLIIIFGISPVSLANNLCVKIHNDGAIFGSKKYAEDKTFRNNQAFFIKNVGNNETEVSYEFGDTASSLKKKSRTFDKSDWIRIDANKLNLLVPILDYKNPKCVEFNKEKLVGNGTLLSENIKDYTGKVTGAISDFVGGVVSFVVILTILAGIIAYIIRPKKKKTRRYVMVEEDD